MGVGGVVSSNKVSFNPRTKDYKLPTRKSPVYPPAQWIKTDPKVHRYEILQHGRHTSDPRSCHEEDKKQVTYKGWESDWLQTSPPQQHWEMRSQ